jgi:uncharacterized protein (DUF1697 family)
MLRDIAFLRAINVGGHNVKMAELRRLFEALGLSNVETFIASGNVIFDSPAGNIQSLEKQIENYLQQALGYEVATFIRSAAELAAITKYQPFPTAELAAPGYSLYIALLKTPPSDEAQQKLLAFQTEIDDFHIHEREIYWLCRQKMSESTFSGALLEKTLGMPATMRNSTTVKKLAAKYAVKNNRSAFSF